MGKPRFRLLAGTSGRDTIESKCTSPYKHDNSLHSLLIYFTVEGVGIKNFYESSNSFLTLENPVFIEKLIKKIW